MSDPRTPTGGPLVPEVAGLLLAGLVEHYATTEGAPPLPERQYIAGGGIREVAYDCEQVTVACAGIGPGPSPDRSQSARETGGPMIALTLRHAVFAVSVVRKEFDHKAPEVREVWNADDDPTVPTAAALTAIGLRHMRDLALVSQALVNVASGVRAIPQVKALQREVGNRPDRVSGLVMPGNVDSLGPAGGYIAVEGSFSVTIGDNG